MMGEKRAEREGVPLFVFAHQTAIQNLNPVVEKVGMCGSICFASYSSTIAGGLLRS